MESPSRFTRRLDLWLELLLLFLLIFLPAAYGTVDAWSEFVAFAIAGVMTLLLSVRWMIDRERIGGRWFVFLPIGLLVAIALLQLARLPAGVVRVVSPPTHALKTDLLRDLPDSASVLSRMTITFSATGTRHDLRIVLFATTILLTTLTIGRDPTRMKRILAAITIVGGVTAILALAQDLSHTSYIYWHTWLGEPARNGPFANHSHFGQFMNLSIGAAIALLLIVVTSPPSRWRWPIAILIALSIILGWATIALSLTRGGVIAGAIAGVFVVVMLLTFNNLRWLSAVIALLAIIAAAVLMRVGADHLIARMHTPDLASLREQTNRDTWAMAKSYPLLGTGLGSYPVVFPLFDRAVSTSKADYADDDYLQTLAETGCAGIVAVALFLAIVWWKWSCVLRSGARTQSLAAVGLGYGLLAAMVHGTSDFGQHLPANACLSAITCGLIINLGSAHDYRAQRASFATSAIPAAALVALFAWLLIDAAGAWRGEANWAQARRIARDLERQRWTGDPAEIEELQTEASAAISADPDNAYYRYRKAVYDWRIAIHRYDRGSPDLQRAAENIVDQLNAARVICPTYAQVYLILGQIESSHLGQAIGREHLHLATRLQQNDPTIWFAAGKADALHGDIAAAQAEFRRALELDSTVMSDVADVYLDDLHQPQPLLDLAEGSFYRMYQVGNFLAHRPEYRDLGAATYRRGIELHIIETRRNPTLPNLVSAALGSAEIGKYDVAEEFFAAALKREPTQIDWRARRADSLIHLDRLDEASQEIDAILKLDAKAPQLPELIKRLEAARAKK